MQSCQIAVFDSPYFTTRSFDSNSIQSKALFCLSFSRRVSRGRRNEDSCPQNPLDFVLKSCASVRILLRVALASTAAPTLSDVEPHFRHGPAAPKSLPPQLISYLMVNVPAAIDAALR
jgi:hypothetical protein